MHIQDLGILLYNTAPPIPEMRGHPEFQNWGPDLIAAAAVKPFAPLREVFIAMVDDALKTLAPLNQFLEEQAARLPLDVYWQASSHAFELIAERKVHAAFILSWVSMLGWSRCLGDVLYDQSPVGLPLHGWDHIPYTCALAGMKIGALEAAGQLVQHAYDVWTAAKEGYHFDPEFLKLLNRHRRLAGDISEKQQWAIVNLASELWSSCRHEKPNFRAEVGALLWSLGLIPESQLFMGDRLVSLRKRFFEQIVHQSLKWIPSDPLVQYVWLEMKDRPPFNLKKHKSLFMLLNTVYSGGFHSIFEDLPGPAGKIYAQSVIGFFRGDLGEEQAADYMHLCRLVEKMSRGVNWLVVLRMLGLRDLIARRFNWTEPDVDSQKEREFWYYLADEVRGGLDWANLYPGLPDSRSRAELPIFQLVEQEMGRLNDAAKAGDEEKVLETLEGLRAASLTYWLTIAPPFPSKEEESALQPMLEEQARLLEYVRGAYFLMIFPLLPWHYRRYSTEASVNESKFDPDVGRKEYQELRKQLNTLYFEMSSIAPRYASRCCSTGASIQTLVRAINSHACTTDDN